MVKFHGETAGNLAAIEAMKMQVSVDLSARWPLQLLSCSFDNKPLLSLWQVQSFCVWEMANTASTRITQKDRKSMNILNLNIQYWHQRSEDIAITLPSQMTSNDSQKNKTVTSSASLLLGPCLGLCRWPQAAHIWQQLDYQDFRSATSRLRGRPLGVRNLRRRPRSTASLGLGLCPCSSGFSGANAQFRQAESALAKHAKFDKKSLHFFKAEWLLGSIYIPSTMRKGMLKNKIPASPPKAPTVHSRHLKPSSPALKQDPTTEPYEIRPKPCPVVSLRGTASSWGHRGWKFYGTRDQEKNNDSVHAKCDQSLEGRKIWDSSKRHKKNLTECHANGKIQNIQAWQSPSLLNIPASDPHPGNPLKRIASWWQKLPESVPIWLTSLTVLTSGWYGNCSSRKDRPWV